MRKFKTNLLIRDKRLPIMEQSGLNVNYSILSQEDYILELKKKLVEESQELSLVKLEDKKHLVEELADVLEVIEYLKKSLNITNEELFSKQQEKFNKLGGFDEKIKTNYVEIADDNKDELDYYLNNQHKYPEIKD